MVMTKSPSKGKVGNIVEQEQASAMAGRQEPARVNFDGMREYLDRISQRPSTSANVMPERRIMSVDETRDYLNHILNKPSTSMNAAQVEPSTSSQGMKK